MIKTRIDIETACPTCAMIFTIHGIDKYLFEVGSGYDIAKLKCPNCDQTGLEFDLMRVDDKDDFVVWRRKQIHDKKKEKAK